MRSHGICHSLPGLEQTDSNQRGGGGHNGENRGKGHQGTCIKDTWTKPKEGTIEGGKWGWVGWGEWWEEVETTVFEQ